MAGHVLRARAPVGERRLPRATRDSGILASYLEDAAHFPGGRAAELYAPATEAEVAAILGARASVLPIGAQSSLTGAATPMGETLLSTVRLDGLEHLGADRVRVGAGVSLARLDEALSRAGRVYPPAPTFDGAFVGGTVATNAAGAATFKHGSTRDWVEALTIVLAGGDVLDVQRGETIAHPAGHFEIALPGGTIRIEVPAYHMPTVAKLSAGYYARPAMDLIDLFIGSEGTLGVFTSVTLRVLPEKPAQCLALVPCPTRAAALQLVGRLRRSSAETRDGRDPRGVDASAIEHMDRRCLELLREDGLDARHGVELPRDSAMALLITLDLPPETRAERAVDEIARALDPDAPDGPLARFCRMLADAGMLEGVAIAPPGDRTRAARLLALREAVPAAVNQRIARAREADCRIEKTAADMIVPFDRLDALLDAYDEEFGRRDLDAAVWGHISDGNLHPNVIPRSFADVESGKRAILELGRKVLRLGGAPLAEHGVGRNPVKQRLLQEMYGEAGIEAMRRVKRALDPEWKLSPGVLFPRGFRNVPGGL